MPIRKDEFEKGRILSEMEKTVLNYFRQHKDKAFTASEIAIALESTTGDNFLADLLSAVSLYLILEGLVREKEIIKRVVGGQTYYAAK